MPHKLFNVSKTVCASILAREALMDREGPAGAKLPLCRFLAAGRDVAADEVIADVF